jgi:hypothetical protein
MRVIYFEGKREREREERESLGKGTRHYNGGERSRKQGFRS